MANDNDDKRDMPSDGSTAQASARLGLIQQHIAPKSGPRRQKKIRASEGPSDWSDILAELDHVRKLAQTPKANTTGYIRHKQAGKLWVRERVEMLLDPGSFKEVGSAAGTATWVKANPSAESIVEAEKEVVADFVPSNNVQGRKISDARSVSLAHEHQGLGESEEGEYY